MMPARPLPPASPSPASWELRRSPDGVVAVRDGDALAALYESWRWPASVEQARRKPWAVLLDPYHRGLDRLTDTDVTTWPRMVPAAEADQDLAELPAVREEVARLRDALALLGRDRDRLAAALAAVLALCRVWGDQPCHPERSECLHCVARELVEVVAAVLGIVPAPAAGEQPPAADLASPGEHPEPGPADTATPGDDTKAPQEADRAQQVAAYVADYEQGLSIRAISAKHGVSFNAVKGALKEAGALRRPASPTPTEPEPEPEPKPEPAPAPARPRRVAAPADNPTPAPYTALLPFLNLPPERTAWMNRALCRGTSDPEQFFPLVERLDGPCHDQITEVVKEFCSRCPVITDCRDWAIQTGQTAGIWGGLTTPERHAIRRTSTEETHHAA